MYTYIFAKSANTTFGTLVYLHLKKKKKMKYRKYILPEINVEQSKLRESLSSAALPEYSDAELQETDQCLYIS